MGSEQRQRVGDSQGRKEGIELGFRDEEESEAALLSEAALAEDWERPEEDEAWAGLQRRSRAVEQEVLDMIGDAPDPEDEPQRH